MSFCMSFFMHLSTAALHPGFDSLDTFKYDKDRSIAGLALPSALITK